MSGSSSRIQMGKGMRMKWGWGNGAVDDAFDTVDDAAAPAASQDSNDNLTSCSLCVCVCQSLRVSLCEKFRCST